MRVHTARRAPPPESYTSQKSTFDVVVERYARAAQLPYQARHWRWPIALGWWWFEADRHRDLDGISGAGRKVVLDGLVKADVLPTDTPAHVARFRGEEVFYGVRRTDGGDVIEGVSVAFADATTDAVLATLLIPVRLPDLNELFDLREKSARRAERLVNRGD